MKWINKESGYAENVHLVELTKEEQKLSDDELITLADNHGDPSKGVSHFGGWVRREGDRAEIHVYID